MFIFADGALLQSGAGAYKRGKNTCARTWSKRGGSLFLGEYGKSHQQPVGHIVTKYNNCHPAIGNTVDAGFKRMRLLQNLQETMHVCGWVKIVNKLHFACT